MNIYFSLLDNIGKLTVKLNYMKIIKLGFTLFLSWEVLPAHWL